MLWFCTQQGATGPWPPRHPAAEQDQHLVMWYNPWQAVNACAPSGYGGTNPRECLVQLCKELVYPAWSRTSNAHEPEQSEAALWWV